MRGQGPPRETCRTPPGGGLLADAGTDTEQAQVAVPEIGQVEDPVRGAQDEGREEEGAAAHDPRGAASRDQPQHAAALGQRGGVLVTDLAAGGDAVEQQLDQRAAEEPAVDTTERRLEPGTAGPEAEPRFEGAEGDALVPDAGRVAEEALQPLGACGLRIA